MNRKLPDFFLERDDTLLVIVDIQDRLTRVMEERERVVTNVEHLIELAKLLEIPVVLTEQYPKGLGQTVAEIREALPDYAPLEKMTFSCCDDSTFMERIKGLKKQQVVLTGMETHVCVLQTCIGLLGAAYAVHVPSDAVCSRKGHDRDVGLQFMRDAGAVISCTETVLFQLLKIAGTEAFRTMARRIR